MGSEERLVLWGCLYGAYVVFLGISFGGFVFCKIRFVFSNFLGSFVKFKFSAVPFDFDRPLARRKPICLIVHYRGTGNFGSSA